MGGVFRIGHVQSSPSVPPALRPEGVSKALGRRSPRRSKSSPEGSDGTRNRGSVDLLLPRVSRLERPGPGSRYHIEGDSAATDLDHGYRSGDVPSTLLRPIDTRSLPPLHPKLIPPGTLSRKFGPGTILTFHTSSTRSFRPWLTLSCLPVGPKHSFLSVSVCSVTRIKGVTDIFSFRTLGRTRCEPT